METRSAPCQQCHASAALQQRVAPSARADHAPRADCVRCHMPAVRERTVPHGTFTEHWIRATPGDAPAPNGVRPGSIEPYHARDREGPEARVYQGMGAVVHATLAGDGRALREGADAWGGSGGAGRVRRG